MGVAIQWEYFPRFHDKLDEEIEMTLANYEKYEDERVERKCIEECS